ncbi:MAG: fibronectin type III domain-containing protein [Bacteroidetes bacterium]|nr:fibronectin type III domain-containing protein [Bacteroidota bacterium]
MKLIILFILLLSIGVVHATGLTGTYNIPGDYNTLAAAITDLNTQGVGPGGVILNLLPGNPETAPAGGYSITTLGGTSANPVIIQGNGNTITAYSPQLAGALNDAIFKIIGGDYITIQGFIMQENIANTITTAASNNMTEFGIALFYTTFTDGAKNITIQNNTISLSRLYQNSFGIYSNVRHTATNVTAVSDIASILGSNDNTKIYSNTISDVNQGIVIVGSNTGTFMNKGIDIGGTSPATANTIYNYGLTSNFSAFVSVSISVMGINLNNCLNSNISYNSVSCPGLNSSGSVYGIYAQVSGTLPTSGGPFMNTFSHNNLSIKSGLVTGNVYGLFNGVGNSLISYDESYNDFNNMGHNGTAPSGSLYCLYSSGAGNAQTINYNTFTNLSPATTGSVYMIYYNSSLPLASSTQTLSYNSIVTGFNKPGGGSATYCMYSNSSSVAGSTKTISFNNFSNITLTGSTALVGFQDTDGGSPVKSIHDNTLSNVTGGSGTITGLNFNYGSASIYNNTFSNISGSGAINVMSCGGSNATSQNVYSNSISGISSTGASAIYGIQSLASGSGAISNIYKNKICNISGSNASSVVYGIYISAGTTINTYNNMISDLKSPAVNAANNLAGIYISGGTTNNVFYNSVYLSGTSTGAIFGSSALYASTIPVLDMRDNILVNTCIPVGAAGFAAAFRRSTATLTTYSNNSNANCLYAGSPGPNNLLYYDGTNSCQTMTAYQSVVSPRDILSFSELPPFIGGISCFDLHFQPVMNSLCSSGAVSITSPISITDDIDGNIRSSFPDVGADEFESYECCLPPLNFNATIISSQQINLTYSLNPSNDSVMIVWNTTGMFTAPVGSPLVGSSMAGGTVLSYGIATSISHTGLTPGITYYYKAFSRPGSSYSAGVTASGIPSVAPPSGLSANAVSSSQVNLAYTLNQQSNNVVIATNNSPAFGNPVNGTALNLNDIIPGGGTVIYTGPANSFNHSGLTAATTYYYKIWSSDAYAYYSTSGAAANATTQCNAISSFPWTENFDAVTIPGLPACWQKGNTSWLTTNNSNSSNDADARSGIQFLRETYSVSNEFIWTPGFTLNAGISYDFSFYWAGDNKAGWTGDVFCNTTQSPTGATQLSSFVTASTTTTKIYSQVLNTFTPPTTGTYYFAIRVTATSAPWYLSFDDFKLEPTNTCFVPTAIAATNVTQNSATLSWNSTASSWDLEYGPAGFTQGSGTLINAVSNPYTLTGLSAGTAYSFYVRSVCPGPTTGNWSLSANFTTECDYAYIPFMENFDFYTAPSVGCGMVVDANSDGKKWATSTGSVYDGVNKLSIGYSAAGVPMDDWYFTRGLHLIIGQVYTITFYYRAALSSFPEKLEVKCGSTRTPAGMTSSAVFSQVGFTNMTYSYGIGTFIPPSTGTYYFGWHCFSDGNEDGIYVDHIQIELPNFHPVVPDYQQVSSAAGTTTFNVLGYDYWNAGSDQPWCSVTQSGGPGDGILVATYTENSLVTQREAHITVTGIPFVDPHVVSVFQAGAAPNLAVSPVNQVVSAAQGSVSYGVTSNSDWTVSCDQAWCTVNLSGSGNGTISANFTENPTIDQRVATITIIAVGVSPVVVTLTQNGSKALHLSCLLEGLYGSGGIMHKARNGASEQFPGNTADQISIELHNASSYGTIAFTAGGINLSTAGMASCILPDNLSGSYYITIKHRNSIETTSSLPVSFAGSSVTYDFTSDGLKAYSGNMKLMPDGFWVLFGGDVNQDGIIDAADMILIDNPAAELVNGYLPEDVDGNGIVDSADIDIVEGNASLFIRKSTP